MWGYFKNKPASPIETETRQWIDGRFDWLGDQLGRDLPKTVRPILPTPEFFPDQFQGRAEDAQCLLNRVAGYMNIDVRHIKLYVYSESEGRPSIVDRTSTSGSAGLYQRRAGIDDSGRAITAIGVEAAQLRDPMSLVATLAHEIGHEILLGQGRISADEEDHEPLTDLLTVFVGLGIFTANATIRDGAWKDGTQSGWRIRRLGYLDQRSFGYALAKFAVARNEAKPQWMRHVRPDVRAPLKASLRFLTEK